MKKKYENLKVGLMGFGMFPIMLSIPSILSSLSLWANVLIGIIFVFLWLFIGVGQFANYFIDIYKSDGLKEIKNEIIFWFPLSYFLVCVVLIPYSASNSVAIVFNMGMIGFGNLCILSFIPKSKKINREMKLLLLAPPC